MPQGFYEMLGVRPDATDDEIRSAFQGRLAVLVRRLKTARKLGADVSLLETQERALREAMLVLSEPARRRRYDAFRELSERGDGPTDASELWERCRGTLMDPTTAAALQVIQALTDLPISAVLPELPAPPRHHPAPLAPPKPSIQLQPPPSQAPPPLRAAPPQAPPPPQILPRPSIDVPILAALPPAEESVDDLARRLGFGGRFLRAVRESQSMSIESLSLTTRISKRYLEAIEDDGYDRLPAPTFVRGYVRGIARELDIDDTDVVQGYMDLLTHARD